MRSFLFLLVPIIFTACNNQDIEKTKLLNSNNELLNTRTVIKKDNITSKERILKIDSQKELNLKKLEAQKAENLAKIEAQKEQKIKELELQKAKEVELQRTKQKAIEANNSLELAKINSTTILEEKAKEVGLYKMVAIVVLFIVFIWLVIRYLQGVAKRRHEAYLKEQEFNYKVHLKEVEMKHKNIDKMLEIIKDNNSDPAIKKEMAKILSYNKNSLIEHKRK